MEALLIADLHAHKHPHFSIPDPTYGTNRLADIVSILDQAESYCTSHSIKYIIVIGDLFHRRGLLDVFVFNTIRDRIKKIKENGILTILAAGNHDQANKTGSVTSIHGLDPYADVIEQFLIDDDLAFIPYSEYRQDIVDQFRICREKRVKNVFAHIPVAGARLVEGYKTTSEYEISLDEIKPKYFKGVYLGHYHVPQFLADNVMFVGSPIHHSFADVGQDKMMIHLKIGARENTLIPVYTEYPAFIETAITNKKELQEFLKKYSEKNFYKVMLGEGLELSQDLWNVQTLRIVKAQATKPRVQGLTALSQKEVVKKYVGYTKVEMPLDYIEYGQAVLDRVKEK